MHVKDSSQVRTGLAGHSSRHGREAIVYWRPPGQNTLWRHMNLIDVILSREGNARGDRLLMRRCKQPNS
jgi:hypothetical protein